MCLMNRVLVCINVINNKLVATLKHLRDIGNTVLVVEHDEEQSELQIIIDIGPHAGIHGGYVVAAGKPSEIIKVKASITGQYLRGEKFIATPKNRRKGNGKQANY